MALPGRATPPPAPRGRRSAPARPIGRDRGGLRGDRRAPGVAHRLRRARRLRGSLGGAARCASIPATPRRRRCARGPSRAAVAPRWQRCTCGSGGVDDAHLARTAVDAARGGESPERVHLDGPRDDAGRMPRRGPPRRWPARGHPRHPGRGAPCRQVRPAARPPASTNSDQARKFRSAAATWPGASSAW
jgi:hypothetical protein